MVRNKNNVKEVAKWVIRHYNMYIKTQKYIKNVNILRVEIDENIINILY